MGMFSGKPVTHFNQKVQYLKYFNFIYISAFLYENTIHYIAKCIFEYVSMDIFACIILITCWHQCIIECISMGIFAYIKAYMSIYVYLTTCKGIDVCIFVYIALCISYLSINVVAYSFFQ